MPGRSCTGGFALIDYYSRRVGEYEQIYRRDDPVRQAEQAQIAVDMKRFLAGRQVLEVACGTGYWTQAYVETARRIVATDASAEMVSAARAKRLDPEKVEYVRADAYRLEGVPGQFDAGAANFWLSHVPRARLLEFLTGLHRKLSGGAVVFMADSVFVPNLGGKLITRTGVEDTYKLRTLSDGSQHEIIKNYYDADDLNAIFTPLCEDLHIHVGKCFWWGRYVIPKW